MTKKIHPILGIEIIYKSKDEIDKIVHQQKILGNSINATEILKENKGENYYE